MEKENWKGELKPVKPKTDGKVICTSCKEFSGWDNESLMYVKPGRNLKCKNCGKVCVNIIDKKIYDNPQEVDVVDIILQSNNFTHETNV